MFKGFAQFESEKKWNQLFEISSIIFHEDVMYKTKFLNICKELDCLHA